MRPMALVLAALLLACDLAQAQTRGPAQRPPAYKPYVPVAVDIAQPPSDPSFAAFRKQLAGIAKRRVFAELAAAVIARGFFWDRDFAGGFDPSKSGVENLASAIGLEAGGGAGWRRLAGFAAEPAATPIPVRVGVICGPPSPTYDETELDRLIETTKTEANAWAHPRSAGMLVRAAPRVGSPVMETLGLHFVHVLGYEAAENDVEPQRTAWARVATPGGKAGFVAPDALRSLSAEQLCYVKDVIGRWRITGYIGRGD
jgi:hypothetical protein